MLMGFQTPLVNMYFLESSMDVRMNSESMFCALSVQNLLYVIAPDKVLQMRSYALCGIKTIIDVLMYTNLIDIIHIVKKKIHIRSNLKHLRIVVDIQE